MCTERGFRVMLVKIIDLSIPLAGAIVLSVVSLSIAIAG